MTRGDDQEDRRPADAALWIKDRQQRGEHVVTRTIASYALVHPGCGPVCEFISRPMVIPPLEHPFYVAAIRKDGTVGPIEHAAWEDIVAHELEQAAGIVE